MYAFFSDLFTVEKNLTHEHAEDIPDPFFVPTWPASDDVTISVQSWETDVFLTDDNDPHFKVCSRCVSGFACSGEDRLCKACATMIAMEARVRRA